VDAAPLENRVGSKAHVRSVGFRPTLFFEERFGCGFRRVDRFSAGVRRARPGTEVIAEVGAFLVDDAIGLRLVTFVVGVRVKEAAAFADFRVASAFRAGVAAPVVVAAQLRSAVPTISAVFVSHIPSKYGGEENEIQEPISRRLALFPVTDDASGLNKRPVILHFFAVSKGSGATMFNTLKYAKILEGVGFTKDQAETSITILVEIMEDKLATIQKLI
jgi:hypothetical protein